MITTRPAVVGIMPPTSEHAHVAKGRHDPRCEGQVARNRLHYRFAGSRVAAGPPSPDNERFIASA